MKKFIIAAAFILVASSVFAADFAACPVASTSVDASYGRYVAMNTQAGGYILHRQTTTILRDIAFAGDVAYVQAVQSGTVVMVAAYDDGNGYFVAVKHIRGNGTVWFSQYNRVTSALVAIGDYVGAGQSIATLAKSPCTTSFAFSAMQRNTNSAVTLPTIGIGLFPGMFINSTAELRAVCK